MSAVRSRHRPPSFFPALGGAGWKSKHAKQDVRYSFGRTWLIEDMKFFRRFVVLIMLGVTPAAAQSLRPVTVENAWVRLLDGGQSVSVFFEIKNHVEQSDRLIEVGTPLADRARLYSTRRSSGRMTYLPIDNLDIGGFAEVRLRPGGYHVRLEGLRRPLRVGDTVPLTLRFSRSGHIEVSARVSNQLLGNR